MVQVAAGCFQIWEFQLRGSKVTVHHGGIETRTQIRYPWRRIKIVEMRICFSVDAGDPPEGQQRAALCQVVGQQVECGAIEIFCARGQHHRMVAAPAYNKPIACNRTVERDDVFRTQVVFHLRLFESGDEGLELLSYFPHPRVGGLVGRVHPGTGGGLQHEDVVDLLSGGKGQRKPCKIQILGSVMRPPGVVCREGGGIIVFACARDTHERQVLV